MLSNLRKTTLTKLVHQNKLYIQLLRNSTSTQPAVKDQDEEYNKQLKQYEKLSNIVPRNRTKKPQRPPFVKNLLLGKFDVEILTYPQLEKEDIDNLEKTIDTLNTVVRPQLESHKSFDTNYLQNLADYKLIGLQSSMLDNGRECNISEYTKIMEILSSNKFRNNLIHNEQLGVQTLIKYGSAELKKLYLSTLMLGKACTAFCMAEENLGNLLDMCTKAALSPDGKHWILSGDKIWVVNAGKADFFVVFALTDIIERDSVRKPKLTAFFVDKNMGGITITPNKIDGLDLCRVTFENVQIPTGNMLGEKNKGDEILCAVIGEYRLSYGPVCTALSKKLANHLHEYLIKETTEENMLLQTDAIRNRIGQIILSIYGMESMTYLTTGLLDTYENQDCELENAIVKYYSSQKTLEIARICQNLIGTPALEQHHWANELLKEAEKYVLLHEVNDTLKIIIALMGLKHAGDCLNEEINAYRNPFYNTGMVFKRLWRSRRDRYDDPKLKLKLEENLHPSLLMAAQNLEYCVHRLRFGTEILLTRYGAEVVNKHIDLVRIADCIIDIYALTAAVGRASRAYCIGLQHGDYEMLIANALSNDIKERVQYTINKVHIGPVATNDENFRVLSKRFIKFKGWFLTHPLARNF